MLNERNYINILIATLFLAVLFHFIRWPIILIDTDLWYHLSGGRYFWQNGTIADDAFFSYITPPKEWYNYYWLFQAIVYKIFALTNYYGLIVLRGCLYFLTSLFIYLLFTNRTENPSNQLISLFLFMACTMVILPREVVVRPHLVSYFLIVLFIYIIEKRRDLLWILLPLGVLWANIHGIEYPVMFMIIFAYLVELYWRRMRRGSYEEGMGKKERWFLILVFYTIFITPGVVELLKSPFSISYQSAAYQHLYVIELLRISLSDIFVFSPVTAEGMITALRNFIILFSSLVFLVSLMRGKLRLSHAILFIGATLLLMKHERFACEYALLCIPLMKSGSQQIARTIQIPRSAVRVALPVVLVVLPSIIFHGTLGNRPAYPFSPSNLPTGVVRYLNHNAQGGRIMNEPNSGGYLPWVLRKEFSIYMDMEMSLFSDLDFAFVQHAYLDANTFKRFVNKYDPSFISVSIYKKGFEKVVLIDPRYVPVFFDHAEVLYVNREKLPGLADKHELKAIKPFHYDEVIYANVGKEKTDQIFAEASRIFDQDPMNFRANHILSNIMAIRGRFDQALVHAENIIRNYPEQSMGYALKGDALFGMKSYDQAASFYRKGLDMGRTSRKEKNYWNLYASYFNMKRYEDAYRILSKYVNPFAPDADYKEVCHLGISAATVGKTREAFTFLQIAQMKVPASDAEYIDKIDENLRMLNEDKEGSGVKR